ncbi:Farnesyl pyrophosphate synthase [Vigna angularis]|uniref:Farnesyl pyrophosphate synthase n=1 Tax=Phaseolus angularis TaxID=3914 RepID=A0A8T0KUS0_PHAAN|nr:Farnesyl pyrophosphate synthase [Vigna angularis]
MRGTQGALIVASTLQIVDGFNRLWRNVVRFLSLLSAVPLVALSGFGLYELGFPVVLIFAARVYIQMSQPEFSEAHESFHVRTDHMTRALSKTYRSPVVDTIQSLPHHQQRFTSVEDYEIGDHDVLLLYTKCIVAFHRDVIKRLVKDKSEKVAAGVDDDFILELKPLSKEAVEIQMKDLQGLKIVCCGVLQLQAYFLVLDDIMDNSHTRRGQPCWFRVPKIGTDIEDFKCSWLVAKALKLSNEQQKKVLYDNYGSADLENVAKVKALYNELNLKV